MQGLEGTELYACWQHIGVQGDRSCEKLAAHVHCRNCERHAEAAMWLLDRHALQLGDADAPPPPEAPAAKTRPALLFRVGQDWLALDPGQLLEVAPVSAIHGLPYRHGRVLLGVCNVRGVLVPALALGPLLGLEAAGAGELMGGRPRHLILDAPGGALVLPVDEVDGVQAVPQAALVPAHQGSSLPASRLAQHAFQWQQRSVTWLDAQHLAQALQESLR